MTVQFVNTSSGPVNSVTWDLGTATTAEQSPDHVYTVAGSYTIGLTVYGPGGTDTVTKTDLFTVQPGPPVSLEISPSDVAIAVQESAQFIAMAADEFGNIALVDAVWTTTGGGGSISDGGAFMAGTMAGEFADIVIASVETGNGDLLAHASITVEPGPLHLVDMASLETPVQVGTQQSLSFAAYDEFLNEITDAVMAWEVAEAAGTITNDGAFEVGTRAGDYPGAIELSVVRGSERIVVTSDLTLLPGPLAEVKVEPSYVLLDDKEDSYQFTAVGADAFGNEISGLAFVWDETEGRINQDGEYYARNKPGRHQVFATASSGRRITGSATVDVPLINWDFTQGTHGWTDNFQTRDFRTTKQGLEFDSIGDDPSIFMSDVPDLGDTDLLIKFRMKPIEEGQATLFWFPPDGSTQGSTLTLMADDGDWQEFEVALPRHEEGTALRLDPATEPGHIIIAWIRVVPNPSNVALSESPPRFVRQWGKEGDGEGEFDVPLGIATDAEGNVYVSSFRSGLIQKFSSDGKFLDSWGGKGENVGRFDGPRGLAVDATGNVYVADTRNNRIQKFDREAEFLLAWGSEGGGDGFFRNPNGVAIDAQGNVYITDRGNHRVQKFTSDGSYITEWGSFGEGEGEFRQPSGIAVHPSGDIYVVEVVNHRIQRFTADGQFVLGWGDVGRELGRLFHPGDVAADSDGNIYVTDSNNNRVQKFTEDGTFLTAWGRNGVYDGEFDIPWSIAVDSEGRIIVTESRNFRVQVFTP